MIEWVVTCATRTQANGLGTPARGTVGTQRATRYSIARLTINNSPGLQPGENVGT